LSEDRVPTPDETAVKVYNLDGMPELWGQYTEKKQQQKQIKSWIDQFGDAVKRLAGDATQLNLGGRKVAVIVAGQLNKTLLAKEQPDIVKQYTREKTVEVFDEALFKQQDPDMYAKYQAQRLVLSGDGK